MKGENAYDFPFHYGQEAESYTFYRVPKILFTAEAFDHLSTDAKLLYGILLDRMQLSVKNSWIDADGKVFIYYPRQCICDALTCGNKKAGQLLAELDDRHGIVGFAAPLFQGGHVVGSLGTYLPAARITDPQKILDTLLYYTKEINLKLQRAVQ